MVPWGVDEAAPIIVGAKGFSAVIPEFGTVAGGNIVGVMPKTESAGQKGHRASCTSWKK